MTSVKLKFRAHADCEKPGALYFQVIHGRQVRQIGTDYRIYADEWDSRRGGIVREAPLSAARSEALRSVRDRIVWEQRKLEQTVAALERVGEPYSAVDIVCRYRAAASDKITVFEYMKRQSERLQRLGRVRTAETYLQTLNSFMKFRSGADLYFDGFDADVAEQYERRMRTAGLSRNTTSFYLRILRCIYNRAVEDGFAEQTDPFRRVYTGVDKTAKRAITLKEIRRIKELDFASRTDLDVARDLFMFSFYMRGMSFIDMAYLQKRDLSNGYITYIRKKTGQQLTIRWEEPMQKIVAKYPENPTPYLLPIILKQDGTERQQYLNKMLFVNRKLKQIAAMAKIAVPLSMYVSRHSWASIAHAKQVPLGVISDGLGHDNEETTRIYLASIRTNRIDEANRRILKAL